MAQLQLATGKPPVVVEQPRLVAPAQLPKLVMVEPVVYLPLAVPQLPMQVAVVVLVIIKRPVMELLEPAAADKEQTSWQTTDPSTPVAVVVVLEETGSTIPMAATVALE